MLRTLFSAAAIALAGMAMGVPAAFAQSATAIFAGGCFWCVEADFDKVEGVISTTSGYIGGSTDDPTYRNHSSAGHREAVRIEYDPQAVSYEELIHAFFRSVDPTDEGGQFCDRGHSYTTAIYTLDEEQAQIADAGKANAAEALGRPIVTEIAAAPEFWPAEDYHQDYHAKNPLRYKYYRSACGRDARIEELWGDEAMAGIGGS